MRLFSIFAQITLLLLASAVTRADDTFAFIPKSDGTIARFRINPRTGEFVALSGATETGLKKSVTVVLSTDKRFLYAYHAFDTDTDGFSGEFETENRDLYKAARVKPSTITVFAIEAGGALRAVQTRILPGPIGNLAPHPNGRFMYALTIGGVFVLRVSDATGKLEGAYRTDLRSGVTPTSSPGATDYWDLTFSPTGATLYDLAGGGFEAIEQCFLGQYAVNPATGQLKLRGEEWNGWSDHRNPPTVKHAGKVVFVKNQTACVDSFDGFYLYPVHASGALAVRTAPFLLKSPQDRPGRHSSIERVIPHPGLPIVVCCSYYPREQPARTIWRITGPGKATKVGEFASAFENRENIGRVVRRSLVIEPGGRFMYETRADWNPSQIAVWTLDKTSKTATLTVPPAPLPADITPEADSQWVFVTLSSKGAK